VLAHGGSFNKESWEEAGSYARVGRISSIGPRLSAATVKSAWSRRLRAYECSAPLDVLAAVAICERRALGACR